MGSVDLKKRIQGFGNGPEPPPLEDNSWWTSTLLEVGEQMGLGPLQSSPAPPARPQQQEAATLEDTITAWVESAKQGWDSVVAALDEEFSGEPRPGMPAVPPLHSRTGLGALAAASAAQERSAREKAAQAREKAAEEKDVPGTYQIVVPDTIVSKTRALGGDVVAKLQIGALVNVIEVVRCDKAFRIRALIDEPCGWISLFHLQTGFRWAEKAEQWRRVMEVPNAMGCTSDTSREVKDGEQEKAETQAEAKSGDQELINLEDDAAPVKESVEAEVQSAELLSFDEDSPGEGTESAKHKKEELTAIKVETDKEGQKPLSLNENEELISWNEGSAGTDAIKAKADHEGEKPLSFDDDNPGTNDKPHGICLDDLAIGDKVMRKGEEAVIVAIDRTMDPPGFVVRMSGDGREISTESHLLQRLPEQAPKEADGDLLSFPGPETPAEAALGASSGDVTAEAAIPRLPPPPQKQRDEAASSSSPMTSPSKSLPRGISIFEEAFNPPPREPPRQAPEASIAPCGAESAMSVAWATFDEQADTLSELTAPNAGASAGAAGNNETPKNILPRAPRGISLFDPLSDKNFNDFAFS
mmetsp:Transcript_141087/g.259140  ORF Transcript_141087/g.259140 Transcript_141087/m.259140 type:complete len:585 (-) Transcript_141087:40-1794(-)